MTDKPDAEVRDFRVRFGEWTVTARWWIVVVTLAFAALAASGVWLLKPSTDYRTFFSDDNPELVAFESFENTYEKSDNVLMLIVPADGNATSERALASTVWLVERAWKTPFASRVDSITNFPLMTAEGDDLYVRDLVDPEKIQDAHERAWIRKTALADPRLAGNLMAQDGSVSAVNITVKLPDGDNAANTAEVAEFVRNIAAEAEIRFPDIDIRLVGLVILNQSFNEATVGTMTTVLPASLAAMALIIGILTRGFPGLAATGSVTACSILATMGLAGWVGIPFSTSTSATPIIVLTLAVASCMHVLVAVQERIGTGRSSHEAVADAIGTNLNPIFLASATTAVGFLMMNFSEVPPYRDLGTLVAIGTGVSFILSVTFLPALLAIFPVRKPLPQRALGGIAAVAELTIRRRRLLLWGSVVVVLGLSAGIPRNELNDVLTHFFDESVQIRSDTDFLDEHLSGNTVLEYSIVSDGPDGIAEPAFIRDVSDFADWYRAQPETRHVQVISDTFRQINMNMNGDDPSTYRLPEDRTLASQYLLLYELSLPFGLDLNNRIDVSKSATRMTVTTRTLSTKEVLKLDARATTWLAENTPNFSRVDSTGASLMFAHMGQRNIRAMLIGTAVAFFVVALLLVAAFRSLRIGLISLVPNFAPGLMAFGLWGLVVAEVGLALSVVMAMTIGIVVDDTVHFLSKYFRARRELGHSPEDAVRYAFRTVGGALFMTTVILVAGFSVLGLSDFLPTAQMGQLTAIVIALALVCDYLFLPPLLMTVDRQRYAKV
ncbi:MAG: MMPL family transporter [Rhodobacteraceae bacterium]|nr:MMPL family transporter [Paracoccaceae bacterium]MCY4137427.1 MMPL family transporter [Paracoccaceae bacterium]